MRLAVPVMFKTVGDRCNLDCIYCYSKGYSSTSNMTMDITLYEKFFKDYFEYFSGQGIFIWQGGEPMLAGLDFFENILNLEVKYAKKNTVLDNRLQTNGTLINDRWAIFFKKYNFLVGISIDGPALLNDINRIDKRGNGTFNRALSGLHILQKYKVSFSVLTVVGKHNVNNAEALFDFYINEGIDSVQFIPQMSFKSVDSEMNPTYALTAFEYGKFLQDFYKLWLTKGRDSLHVRFFEDTFAALTGEIPTSCMMQKECPISLVIDPVGGVFPCDFYMSSDWKLGDIRKNSIQEIIESEKLLIFRKRKTQLNDECVKCKYKKLCYGGCPRNRIYSHETISPDIFCQSYKLFFENAEKLQPDLFIS